MVACIASHPPFTRKRRDNRIAYIDLSSKQCNAMPMAVVQHMHEHHIMIIFVDIHSLNLLLCHAHQCILLIDCIFIYYNARESDSGKCLCIYLTVVSFVIMPDTASLHMHVHTYMYVYGCVPINNELDLRFIGMEQEVSV